MKQYLTMALAIAFIGLAISLVVMKRADNAQHDADASAIDDFSNRLDSAQIQIASDKGTMLTLSNSLGECRSASSTLSNQLTEAASTIAVHTQQITNLTRHVAETESEKQALGQRVMDLTNQLAGLASQRALTETNLAQANNDYALLENRFRRNVAERLVVERKFNNLTELEGQVWYLKQNPNVTVTAESIYAGLDVEVKSNAVHVITPN